MPKAADIAKEASKLYVRYNSTVKANYMYLKRIIEHLVFKLTLPKLRNWKSIIRKESEEWSSTVQNILDERYIELGVNLTQDDDEIDSNDDLDNDLRTISVKVINNIMSYPGIWARYGSRLNK